MTPGPRYHAAAVAAGIAIDVTRTGQTVGMAFGQSSGPPAMQKQIDELLELLADLGFENFREARYQFDFTQRQANGKFSRDEADHFIELLRERSESGAAEEPPAAVAPKPSSAQRALQKFSDEDLAAELQRRGWIVAEA